MLDRTAI